MSLLQVWSVPTRYGADEIRTEENGMSKYAHVLLIVHNRVHPGKVQRPTSRPGIQNRDTVSREIGMIASYLDTVARASPWLMNGI
jgi:hypothetical protein